MAQGSQGESGERSSVMTKEESFLAGSWWSKRRDYIVRVAPCSEAVMALVSTAKRSMKQAHPIDGKVVRIHTRSSEPLYSTVAYCRGRIFLKKQSAVPTYSFAVVSSKLRIALDAMKRYHLS